MRAPYKFYVILVVVNVVAMLMALSVKSVFWSIYNAILLLYNVSSLIYAYRTRHARQAEADKRKAEERQALIDYTIGT